MGATKAAEELLNNRADVNKASRLSFTPVLYAAWQGHDDTLQLLINRGADCTVKPNPEAKTSDITHPVGTVRWVIRNFSTIPEKSIKSPPFRAGCFTWCVLMYPKGMYCIVLYCMNCIIFYHVSCTNSYITIT